MQLQCPRETYGLDGEDHARLHRANSAVLGVVWDIRRGVEEVIDAVSGVLSDDSASCCTRDGLAVADVSGQPSVERTGRTYMAFPRSRKRAPGLHSLMASSKLCRAARMSFLESSSTRPTGYVSFRSP